MSRSYRKIGIWKDHWRAGSAKSWKVIANRRVRRKSKQRELGVGGRNGYRRLTDSWNIHDYKELETEAEARQKYREAQLSMSRWTNYYTSYETEDEFIELEYNRCRRK